MAYTVDGNVEWLIENAFVDVVKNNFAIRNVFGQGVTINVRVARDATAVRGWPAVAIEAISEQTLPNSNEYRCTMRFFCETDPNKTDKTGEQVKALVGAIRDILHADDIIDQINDQQRGVQMNSPDSLHEATTEDDSRLEESNPVRRMIIIADAWVYVGTE